NLLAGDMFHQSTTPMARAILFMMMTLGALLFAFATEKLEAMPAMLLFLAVMSGVAVTDVKVLFANQMNWNTGLLYIELLCIFMFTLAIKYVLEEKNKKFIRGAFAKYVSPAIIDGIMK